MAPPDPSSSSRPGLAHRYELRSGPWARDLIGIVGVFVAVVVVLGAMSLTGVLPARALLSDPDSTILGAKAEMASSSALAPAPSIAFVGDSSCLVNIDVPTLRSEGIEAVNLGTLSYLGIDDFGRLAGRFCAGRSGMLIVLVVHPEGLQTATTSPDHRRILQSALEPGTLDMPGGLWDASSMAMFDGFRDRVLDRWIPTPLRGRLGARYGFTRDLRREVLATGGTLEETSLFDPGLLPKGPGEYRMARRISGECGVFRTRLPRDVRLWVLVSPIPASRALRGHEARMTEIHRQLSAWLETDQPALPMPVILPDPSFGTVTHLLPPAAREYTRTLAPHLKPR